MYLLYSVSSMGWWCGSAGDYKDVITEGRSIKFVVASGVRGGRFRVFVDHC